MVALLERCSAEAFPHIFSVHCPSHLQRNRQIPTLDSEVESCLLILHEMKRNLRVPLLLQVPDDALSDEVGSPDDLQYLVVVFAYEGELETVLCWVDRNCTGLRGPVEAVYDLTFDPSEVDGLVKRLYDSVIPGQLSVESP